jgi:UDP-glucuronate 4-epimerase
MKVLITGGAGSIGTYVTRALLERGDEVTVVDNFNDFYDPAFKRRRFEILLKGINAPQLLETDITNGAAIQKVVRVVSPERIIHLASWPSVQPSVKYPELYTTQNVVGTVNVFQAAVDAGVGGVVFASSSSIYGRDTPAPFREDAPCNQPLAPYGASKRSGELYAAMYHYLHKLPVTCLRFFTVYGPWIRPDMAAWRLTASIEKGEPIQLRSVTPDGATVERDFTYIDDIVRGVLAALDRVGGSTPSSVEGFDIVNIGNDDPVPLTRLVAAIETALGKKAQVEQMPLAPEEAVVTAADLTHAREILGYEPTVSIEDGMKRVADWYRNEFVPGFPNGLAKSKYWG